MNAAACEVAVGDAEGTNFAGCLPLLGMELPTLVPIEYRGELVALVSSYSVHIIAPRLRACPAGDPELTFVTFMCVCCAEVMRGRIPGPYSNELGEEWARQALHARSVLAEGG